MSTFNCRVVLHNATAHDYTRLHQALKAKGIDDLIAGDDGGIYRLPPGEYNCAFQATAAQVRDHIASIVRTVYSSYAVRATEAGANAWQGLEKVSASSRYTSY